MAHQHPQIADRRELFDYLGEQMERTYRQDLAGLRVEKETTFVKTYVLEFDWTPGELEEDETSFLSKALAVWSGPKKGAPSTPRVAETDEEGFYIVDWKTARGSLRVYLDTVSDPQRRFWLGYSLADAVELDRIMDRLSSTQPAFDRAWFWPELLRRVQEMGEFRGVGLDYDHRRFDAGAGRRDSTDYFKVQLWGGPETREILDFVERDKRFGSRTVLAKVRMKYWDDPGDRGRFALEDIKYNGKLTTRGTSFGTHQSLLSNLRCAYSNTITEIEKRHTVHINAEGDMAAVEGDPLFLFLGDRPIEDLDAFCSVVFSGHLPFRLWGVPEPLAGDEPGRMVSAVDLHTGSKLFFEVYPDVICLYLQPGACGNTVARFFTNMQHTFSRQIRGEDNEGHPVFQPSLG